MPTVPASLGEVLDALEADHDFLLRGRRLHPRPDRDLDRLQAHQRGRPDRGCARTRTSSSSTTTSRPTCAADLRVCGHQSRLSPQTVRKSSARAAITRRRRPVWCRLRRATGGRRCRASSSRGVPQPRLDHLHVSAASDQQRGEVVPQVVEPEPRRQALARSSRAAGRPARAPRVRAGRPTRPSRARLAAGPAPRAPRGVAPGSAGSGPASVRSRSSAARPGTALAGATMPRMKSTSATRRPHTSASPQAGERAEQDRRAQLLGHRVVQRPHLRPSWPRRAAACACRRRRPPRARRSRHDPVVHGVGHDLRRAGRAARRRSWSRSPLAFSFDCPRPDVRRPHRGERQRRRTPSTICATCTSACRTVDGRRVPYPSSHVVAPLARRSCGRSSGRRACRQQRPRCARRATAERRPSGRSAGRAPGRRGRGTGLATGRSHASGCSPSVAS